MLENKSNKELVEILHDEYNHITKIYKTKLRVLIAAELGKLPTTVVKGRKKIRDGRLIGSPIFKAGMRHAFKKMYKIIHWIKD